MAALAITAIDFFNNGLEESNSYVGVDWDSHNRVVRYTFTAPNGGSSVDVKFTYCSLYDGNNLPLHFYIGTDPNSHKNAGADSEYSGVLNYGGSNSAGQQGSADVTLIPGLTYYLFIFPSYSEYSLWTWQSTAGNEWNTFALIDASGSAGGANIGGEYYLATIGNEMYIPYIGIDGEWILQI